MDDFYLHIDSAGRMTLWIRFKAYKQDPRIERPEAREAAPWLPEGADQGGRGQSRDWVPIGDVVSEPLFSIGRWYQRFAQLRAMRREAGKPAFYARDRVRCYTYSCLMADFRAALSAQ